MKRATDGLAALGVAAAGLALYAFTLAPGLLWGGGDFARFQTWAYLGRIEGEVDLFAHPLWVYLAHPFTRIPIGDAAWRANFASAVFAAAALAFVFATCRRVAQSTPAALFATAALAVSHTFWTYAVLPKVYSLNALILAACLFLLVRWRERGKTRLLAAFSFLYGLGFLNHIVMATAAAGLVAYVVAGLSQSKPRGWLPAVIVALLAFAFGVLPAVLLGAGTSGHTVDRAIGFLQGVAYPFAHPVELARGIGWALALGIYQFPLTAPLVAIGLVSLGKRDGALALSIALIGLGTVAFLLGALDPQTQGAYVWNLHYYLQVYVALAPALACGFVWLERRWMRGRAAAYAVVAIATVGAPPLLYAAAPVIARRVVSEVPDFRSLPGRDNFAYVLTPWKNGETAPRPYAESLLGAMPQSGVLFADYALWSMIHYLQVVDGQRPDVELVMLRERSTQVSEILTRRLRGALYLADTNRYYDVDGISQYFEIVPDESLYRLRRKAGALAPIP